MERIKRGESHHGFAIRLLIFRLKDTIRDSWVLCAEGPSTVYLYRALDQLHFCYIYTVLGPKKKKGQDKVWYVLIRLSTDKEPNQKVEEIEKKVSGTFEEMVQLVFLPS